MESDCGFARENYWFRFRSTGIIVRDNKVLFVKSKIGGYYYMIGGGVHLGEDSRQCAARELLEEAKVECEIDRLAIVCENFFDGDESTVGDKECHELQFCWLATAPEDAVFADATDKDEELVWLPLDDLKSYDIKPFLIRDNLEAAVKGNGIIHVINDTRSGSGN